MRCRWALALIAASVMQGCYTYAPLQTGTPPVGERMSFHINDRGRVELGDRLGPGVTEIEGRLAQDTGEQMSVSVIAVSYVGGERSVWSGETVRFDRSFVHTMQSRKLDKKRTWFAAGAATAVVVAFVASRGLLGAFTGDREEPEPPPPISFFPRVSFRF